MNNHNNDNETQIYTRNPYTGHSWEQPQPPPQRESDKPLEEHATQDSPPPPA